MNDLPIRRALLSVSDKSGLVEFAKGLADFGVTLISTGGTRRELANAGLTVLDVSDVTGFPDTSQLLLLADALITDYSSVMFDFSVTGKPMYFLVPDMEHYRGELRGFYFDLAAHAPGPMVRSQEELVAALGTDHTDDYAARYAQWRQKFNARDDGRAAERVVTRILDQGFISA